MKHIYSFEKMIAWQMAREVTKQIYILTQAFPREELFGITSQMRRAMVSVCCNLAEGSARLSGKSQQHYYQIAYGSTIEVINLLIICTDITLLSTEQYDLMRTELERLTFQINKLVNRDPDNLSEPDIPYEI